jgi:mono/diheme cytochrome c family protein
LPGEDARSIVVNDCLGCHDEPLLLQQRLTAKQWAAVVKKMLGWGAPTEPENVEPLVAYLAAHYGPDAGPYRVPEIDLARVEAAFAPLPDGKFANGNVKKGRLLYAESCASCHGVDGHGSPTGMSLADRPLLWHAAEIAAIVKKGRGRMPKFPISDAQIAAIVAFMRTL